jgi:DNA helicase-2/ATP-dependent DNA helicase PcrA
MFFEDSEADKTIKSCIAHCKNFTVVAGAGSGKTGSLIKALAHVRSTAGKDLRSKGQQIACITYTNAAVEVIKKRTGLDDLFLVSTIHGFLWELIKSYQRDIKKIVKEELLPKRIDKKKDDDNGGNSIAARKARAQLIKLEKALNVIDSVNEFNYDDGGRRDYALGRLDHDDIIDLSSLMILKFNDLQRIIGQKYPFIFIDEAQDTFPNVIEALNLFTTGEGLPMIGYFGDPMQQIYEKRAGQFSAPEGAELINKKENFRCSIEVIKLLNAIRPQLEQTPGEKNLDGSVEIRLIQSEVGEGYRKAYSDKQKEKVIQEFDKALLHFGWLGDESVKKLFLTRQMIAHRLGFSSLNRLFTGIYSSKSSEDTFKEGDHFLVKPFVETIIPIITAYQQDDWAEITHIMRKNSPLLDPKGESEKKTLKQVSDALKVAVECLSSGWEHVTVRSILEIAIQYKIILASERLIEHLERPPRCEEYEEVEHVREKGDWLADSFFELNTSELSSYRNFVLNETPYSTQHGVKGEEFSKVLVVFDDTEASWHNYSFSKLLTPVTAGKEPTVGQKTKSLNLAYVSFSRAEKDLRIILFTLDPNQAKRELITSKLFTETQITIQS